MHVELALTLQNVRELLLSFAPIRIHFTERDEDRRWIELDTPSEISLVPGRGVRAVCSGRVRYEVVSGLKVPLAIRRLQVVLEPQVVALNPTRQRLEFRLIIEAGDLENVPGVVDRAIVSKAGEALTPQATHMYWDFTDTFAQSIAMPERLEPLDRLALSSSGAEVTVTETSLRVRFEVNAVLSRTKPTPTDDF